jgi:hypothetical protein
MKTFRQLSEASVHPMAVHAYPSGKNQFTVHAVGSKVKHVKPGEKVSSSDLDDLSDAGHKVKEVNKPMNEDMSTAGTLSSTASTVSNTMKPDMAKKEKTPKLPSVKEDVVDEGIIKGTASLVKHAVGVPMKAAGRAAMGAVNAVHAVAGGVKNTVKDVKDASKKVKAAYAEEVVDEGKANWDKAHKHGLIDTLHNRMLHKKSMPKMGTLSKAATRELAAKAMAAGKGGKIQEAESGLSTKTLANYSVKASAATTDKDLPMKKTGNRYAGVSKVDKILAMRDKRKVD